MRAHQGNLCDPSDPDPAAFRGAEFWGFDVAAVGLGFHHFDDPGLAAARLAARLRPGGVLVILDFLPHGEIDVSANAVCLFASLLMLHLAPSVFPNGEPEGMSDICGKVKERDDLVVFCVV